MANFNSSEIPSTPVENIDVGKIHSYFEYRYHKYLSVILKFCNFTGSESKFFGNIKCNSLPYHKT